MKRIPSTHLYSPGTMGRIDVLFLMVNISNHLMTRMMLSNDREFIRSVGDTQRTLTEAIERGKRLK